MASKRTQLILQMSKSIAPNEAEIQNLNSVQVEQSHTQRISEYKPVNDNLLEDKEIQTTKTDDIDFGLKSSSSQETISAQTFNNNDTVNLESQLIAEGIVYNGVLHPCDTNNFTDSDNNVFEENFNSSCFDVTELVVNTFDEMKTSELNSNINEENQNGYIVLDNIENFQMTELNFNMNETVLNENEIEGEDNTLAKSNEKENSNDDEDYYPDKSDENSEEETGQDTRKNTSKRKKDSKSWQNKERKEKRNSGHQYVNSKGKIVKPRSVQSINCNKCLFNCHEKISENERLEIHKSYWETGLYERQRDFICQNVQLEEVTRRRKDRKGLRTRNNTYRYFLKDKNVCKKFFLATLNIGEKTVVIAKKKEKSNVGISQTDERGRHVAPNKTSEDSLIIVRKHIESFPKVESHYCRKKSTKLYLESNLNLAKMYDLYTEFCQNNNKNPVKLHTYRRIFNNEYNYSFHKPKKDTCRVCERFKNLKEKSEAEIVSYNNHISNKDLARKEKANDKKRAEEDETFKIFTFDLESVLYTPCAQVSTLFYSRKFCSYNLTIYDNNSKNGYCYLWHETDGERGSDEIGTCLFLFIKNHVPSNVKHISFFSDSCSGQNRNRYITCLMLYIVQHTEIETIEQKFLETGHTQMECDSMHSSIESAKKGIQIYSPEEWATILRLARRKKPYFVNKLTYSNFLNLKHLHSKSVGKNNKMNMSDDKRKISWLHVKCVLVKKSEPNYIFVKTSWSMEDYIKINIKNKKSKRLQKDNLNSDNMLEQKFSETLKISAVKKKDLMQLCTSGIVPEQYREFYINLQPCQKKRDYLQEKNETDESVSDE